MQFLQKKSWLWCVHIFMFSKQCQKMFLLKQKFDSVFFNHFIFRDWCVINSVQGNLSVIMQHRVAQRSVNPFMPHKLLNIYRVMYSYILILIPAWIKAIQKIRVYTRLFVLSVNVSEFWAQKHVQDNCLKCTSKRWCRTLAALVLLKISPLCPMKCLFDVANINYSYVTHLCACWDVDGVQRLTVLKYISLQENQDRPTYSRTQQIISTDVKSSGCSWL